MTTRTEKDLLDLVSWPLPKRGVNKDVDEDVLGQEFFVKCVNAYLKDGQLEKVPGYLRIGTIDLGGPVQLIKEYHLQDGTTITVVAQAEEVYKFNPVSETVTAITRYNVGDIDVTNGSPVVSTDHGSANFESHLKPGDKLIDVNGVTVDYTILTVDSDNQFTLTANWAGATNTDQTFIVQQVMNSGGFWRATEFKDTLYLTNGSDPLYRWEGSDGYLELVPGSPPVCKYVFGYDAYLFLGWLKVGGNNFGRNVKWPDSQDPENWTTGDAQERILPSDWGEIIGFEELRSQLIVHRRNSQDYAEYFGGDWIFLTARHAKGVGAIGPGAFLNMESGRFHIIVGDDDIYTFNGTPPERVARGIIAQWLTDHVNPSYKSSVLLHKDVSTGLIYLFYPTLDAEDAYCDAGFVYEPASGGFFEIDTIPLVTATGTYHMYETLYIDDYEDIIDDVFTIIDSVTLEENAPLTLIGDSNGYLWKLHGMNKTDGASDTAIDVEVITATEYIDDPTQLKLLLNTYFDADANGSTTIDFYVGVKDSPLEDWTWKGPFDVPKAGSTSEKVELHDGTLPGVKGKYFCRKFVVSGVNTAFEVRNIWLEKGMEGDR